MVTAEMAADKIADVIAHEAGHLLGESHAVETGTLQDYAAVVPVVPPTPDVPDEKNEKYFVLDYDGDGVQELAFVNGKNCFSVYGKGTSLSVTDIADGFTVVGVGDFEATGKDGLPWPISARVPQTSSTWPSAWPWPICSCPGLTPAP